MSAEFSCKLCNKVVSSLKILNEHQVVHTREKPFKCRFCPRRFGWRSQLTSHEKTHTGKLFCCPTCNKGFITTWHLKRHIRSMHSNDDNPENNFLGKMLGDVLARHSTTNQPQNDFVDVGSGPSNIFADVFKSLTQSVECDTMGGEKNSDHQAMSQALGQNDSSSAIGQFVPDLYLSEDIGYAYNSSLSGLAGGNHNPEDEDDCMITETENLPEVSADSLSDLQQFSLTQVSSFNQDLVTPYRSRDSMRMKCQNIATQDVVPMCYICGQVFPTKRDVYHHYLDHDAKTPGQSKTRIYRCLDCGWDFSRKSLLMQHQKFHSGGLHKCRVCGKGFTNRWFLERHEKIHNKRQRFVRSKQKLSSTPNTNQPSQESLPSGDENKISSFGERSDDNDELGLVDFESSIEKAASNSFGSDLDCEEGDSFGPETPEPSSSSDFQTMSIDAIHLELDNDCCGEKSNERGSLEEVCDKSESQEEDPKLGPIPVTLFKKEAASSNMDFENVVLSMKKEMREAVNFTVNICPENAEENTEGAEIYGGDSRVSEKSGHCGHSDNQVPSEVNSKEIHGTSSSDIVDDKLSNGDANLLPAISSQCAEIPVVDCAERDHDDLGMDEHTSCPLNLNNEGVKVHFDQVDRGHACDTDIPVIDVEQTTTNEKSEPKGRISPGDNGNGGESLSQRADCSKELNFSSQSHDQPVQDDQNFPHATNGEELRCAQEDSSSMQSTIKPIDVVPKDLDPTSQDGFIANARKVSQAGSDTGPSPLTAQLEHMQALMLQQFSNVQEQMQQQRQQLDQMQQLMVQQQRQQEDKTKKMVAAIKQLQQQVKSQQQTISKLSSQNRVKVHGSLNFSFDPENGNLKQH